MAVRKRTRRARAASIASKCSGMTGGALPSMTGSIPGKAISAPGSSSPAGAAIDLAGAVELARTAGKLASITEHRGQKLTPA